MLNVFLGRNVSGCVLLRANLSRAGICLSTGDPGSGHLSLNVNVIEKKRDACGCGAVVCALS